MLVSGRLLATPFVTTNFLNLQFFDLAFLVPLLVRLCGGFCFCATSKAIKATWKEADLRAPFFMGGSENLAIQSLKQNPAKPIKSHGKKSTFFFLGGWFRVRAHWKKTYQGLSEPQGGSQAFYDTRLFLRELGLFGAPHLWMKHTPWRWYSTVVCCRLTTHTLF